MKRQAVLSRLRFALLQPKVAMTRPVTFIRSFAMKLLKRVLPASAGLLLLLAPAVVEAQGQRIIFEQSNNGSSHQEGLVRVQSNVNLFVPGPTGEGSDADKLRERARRMIYDMAAHECDLLRDTLAKDCRLESITSSLNRQQQFGQQQQQDGYMVNGNMSLQITLK
jgi:hypothetical protein